MTDISKGKGRRGLKHPGRHSFFCGFYSFAGHFLFGCLIFAAFATFVQMGFFKDHFVTAKIVWLLGTAGIAAAMIAGRRMLRRYSARERIAGKPVSGILAEAVPACLLMLAGLILRMAVILSLPAEPSSDFATYYTLADMLSRNAIVTEGAGYVEYVSLFPHVLGYPAVLSVVFRVFGTSVYHAQVFNLVLQTLAWVMIWRTARCLGGRISGLIALAFVTLLPSAVLFSNMVAGEPLFTCLQSAALLLFVRLVRADRKQDPRHGLYLAGLILLGLILAFSSFIRPMGIIFLIAAVICIFTLPERKSDGKKRFLFRLTDRRWKRSLILAVFYFLGSMTFSAYTARTIQREPAGASASFGYNLLVGLNLQSFGNWNEEDMALLEQSLRETGSATEAHRACLARVGERLKAEALELPLLLGGKFAVLWALDYYGEFWNEKFLEQQGKLTPERAAFLNLAYDPCDMFYLFMLICAAFYVRHRFRKQPDAGYAAVLALCGIIALHLLVETQNRYHYCALYFLAIPASMGIRPFIGWAEALGIRMRDRFRDRKNRREKSPA